MYSYIMNLRKTLLYGILGSLFVTPFLANYVSDSMFFPFITGKNFAFRILVEIATALWVVLLIIDKEFRPKFSWVLASAGAFLAALFIADFSGVDSYKSIWSNYERMEGLVTHIHLFLYFIVLGSVMIKEKYWAYAANLWLIASVFVSFGAFRQIFGTEQYYFGSGRIDAGLGNAAYMGIYVVFNVFLAILLWIKTEKENWYRWAYPIFVLVNFYLAFKSQTRGSILGLFGGLVLSALIIAIFDKTKPQLRKWAFGAVGLFIILAGLFIANRNAAWIKNYPSLSRMAAISAKETTAETRLTIWKMSFEGFKERPVFGWGQENFIYVFAKHYDPIMWKYEPWYDRSHNVFFDWLIAAGAVGLLTYLSLYVGILYYLWINKKGENFSFNEKAIITGLLGAYFIHNLFVFDNLVSYMFFFAFLGFIHKRATVGIESGEKEKIHKKDDEVLDGGDSVIVLSVVLAILAATIYFLNIREINANHTLIKSLRGETAIYVADGKQKIRIFEALDEAVIGRGEIREQIVQQATQVLQMKNVGDDIKKQYVSEATKVISETLKETPDDLRMLSTAINLYSVIGNYDQADAYFKQAITVSPTRGMLYLDYVNSKLMKGDLESALNLSKKAMEIMPENKKAKIAYASILVLQGKSAEAKKIVDEMKGSSDLIDDRLIYAYGNIKAYNEIISIFESVTDKTNITSKQYLYYADALQAAGRKKDSIEILKKISEMDPSLKDQIDAYIKQMEK